MNKKLFTLAALALTFGLSACLSDTDLNSGIEKYVNSDEGRKVVGGAVEKYFQDKQEEQRKAQEKAEEQELEDQFKNPVKIEVGNSPVTGAKNAKVTIIEFSDFQCPFCKRGKDTMEQILKAYPNDVRVVFKHMPLSFHKMAKPCALATIAAGKQGKFWEMHNEFFDNQGSLSDEFIVATAKKLGLNIDKFNADRGSKAAEEQLNADIALAGKNGISGTPGFFVNGVAVKGAYPFDHFKKIIDRWLQK